MGLEGITVFQRYLKQTYQDTEASHSWVSPVDNSEFLSIIRFGSPGWSETGYSFGTIAILVTELSIKTQDLLLITGKGAAQAIILIFILVI
jgi:hypothetical protein